MTTTAFPVPPLSDEGADALLADMERLGRRTYSEIGVPMFLVAEDLTGASPPAPPDAKTSDGASRALAHLLAEAAEAMQARRPDFAAKDIGRLIEVLADRHLLGLATPPFSRMDDLHPAIDPAIAAMPSKDDDD